jgi:acetylornithine deacetylase/succinyl-diaminopimelate desuccinylase-like protein
MDASAALASSDRTWEQEIIPALEKFIRIPNKSPAFEPDWVKQGHMELAVLLVSAWCRAQRSHIPGLDVEVVRLNDEQGRPRTPMIVMEVPGDGKDTILLYGHLDKQPEMTGWREGLSPWEPVREGDRLYGRGAADDGYAAFASLTALRLLREQKISFARCVILIEACEESGSTDLPAYIDHLSQRIGQPSLVVCLDSGCPSYEQLGLTTSLRGLVSGNLRIDILKEGVHSGDASGLVPSSFRILRMLLDRIDDVASGKIRLEALHVEIPKERLAQAKAVAQALGTAVYDRFPWVEGAQPVTTDPTELILNRTWRPALSVTGVDGMPTLGAAGNVLRPFTAVKVSLRIPPRLDPDVAGRALKDALEKDPPYGAKVSFDGEKASAGWDAPVMSGWLEEAIHGGSRAYFGKPFIALGEGGTIPFMEMLGRKFPKAQFMITGLLGPGSNAHGPNEFLHIPTGKKLTACVANVIAAQYSASRR